MRDLKIIDKCIKAFKNSNENLEEGNRRYRYNQIINKLEELKNGVTNNTYPKDLDTLNITHLFDNVFDSKELYIQLWDVVRWYKDNYREKHPLEIKREKNKKYLIEKLGMKEKMANKALLKLTLHNKGDLYFEFSEFVETEQFVRNGIKVEGYTAEDLYNTGKLSVLGAYNFLIYLREDPKNALADLKVGLPRK